MESQKQRNSFKSYVHAYCTIMVHLPPKRLFRFIFNLREYCAVLLINQPDHTTPRSCEAKETLCCEIDSSESECYVNTFCSIMIQL